MNENEEEDSITISSPKCAINNNIVVVSMMYNQYHQNITSDNNHKDENKNHHHLHDHLHICYNMDTNCSNRNIYKNSFKDKATRFINEQDLTRRRKTRKKSMSLIKPLPFTFSFKKLIFPLFILHLFLLSFNDCGIVLAQSSSVSSSPHLHHNHYHQHHGYSPSSSSTSAAIVRRLHYSPSASSSPVTSTRTNPYRSMMIQPSSGLSPSSSHSLGRLSPSIHHSSLSSILSPKGIAKVTPISLQSPSFDSNIRLVANQLRPMDSANDNSPSSSSSPSTLLQKTSTLIKVLEIGASLNETSTPTATTIATTNTPTDNNRSNSDDVGAISFSLVTPKSSSSTKQSSRQGKSIGQNQSDNSNNDRKTTTSSPPIAVPPPLSPIPTTTSSSSSSTSISTGNPNKQDNLCFLSHGGSSETFTVNEAMPVNSIIGQIKVFGDVSIDHGNIELSIIESGSSSSDSGSSLKREKPVNESDSSIQQPIIPIRIEQGTKNLILVRKLDKESVEGESSVTIGVRCRPKSSSTVSSTEKHLKKRKRKLDRKSLKSQSLKVRNDTDNDDEDQDGSNRVENRRTDTDGPTESSSSSYWVYESDDVGDQSPDEDLTSEDDIIIPIRILVTDANDNKPEWQGQTPYSVNISEMTTVGSVVMTGIRAIDNDQLGPYSTVEYYVEPGPYSHLLRFVSPLEGTLILAGQLDYETLPNFWISIRAQDQGNPPNTAVTKVNVQVLDADDQNPRFEVDKYTAILGEGQQIGQPLAVKPKPIRAEDPDRGIQSPIIYEFNSKEEDSRENAYFRIDSKTGQVSLRRPLHSSISLPITLVIRATQMDNKDRYALTTLTIVSKRDQTMPDLRFMHSNYSTSLLESTPPGQVALTVQTTTTPAATSPLRFQILDDEEGYFAVKSTGEIVVNRMLDYEKHHRYSFRLMVTDGKQTDLARITVDIINVNEHDPVFTQSAYVFHVNEARLRLSPVIGQMQATDADDGDRIQLSLSGPHSAAFALSTDGTLRLRSLRMVNNTECHMIATATDSGSPPRSSSASVVVKFAPALLKSLTGRTLETFLFDLERDQSLHNDIASSSSGISPTAVDILQHSAANIFSAGTNSTALVLVIVLGVLLGTLFIIIVALTLHVLKNRKYQSRRSSNCSPVTLHHRHHPSSSSSSSSSSSTSSSSDLSLNGTETAHMAHGHLHHSHHHSHHPHHHWSKTDGDDSATGIDPISKQQHFYHQNGFMQSTEAVTAATPTSSTSTSSSSKSLIRSNKVVPIDTNTIDRQENNEYREEIVIDSDTRKLASTISNQQKQSMTSTDSHQQQLDSAISSGVSSCWSSSSLSDQKSKSTINSNSAESNNIDSNAGNSSSSSSGIGDMKDSRTSHYHIPQNNASVDDSSGTVASRISVIRWPQGSIPRRVKKLTWKDEQRNNEMDQMYTANTTIVQATNNSSFNNNNNTNTGHLNQSIVAKTKTKTLSGHLLTGQMSVLSNNNINSASNGVNINSRTTTNDHHYHHLHHHHHHHLNNNLSQFKSNNTTSNSTVGLMNATPTMIRHHQTPHYPVESNQKSVNHHQLIINNSNSSGNKHHQVTASAQQQLPDLTVYF